MSEPIDLSALGWTPSRVQHWQELQASSLVHQPDCHPGRVCAQHRGVLQLQTELGGFDAEISGRLRYTVTDEVELPAVGDWVAATLRPDEATATVHDVLPRTSALVRGTPGDRRQSAQVLASNVDSVWVVTSMNRDFNAHRIERMLAIVHESGAAGVVVLSKGDLTDDPAPFLEAVGRSAPDTPVHVVSAASNRVLDPLRHDLAPGRTVAIDETGRASPYEKPTRTDLVLHLPDAKGTRALLVGLPAEPSPAQRATYDVLVAGKQRAQSSTI